MDSFVLPSINIGHILFIHRIFYSTILSIYNYKYIIEYCIIKVCQRETMHLVSKRRLRRNYETIEVLSSIDDTIYAWLPQYVFISSH